MKGLYIAPNLHGYVQGNVLYCNRVKCQVREGVSGDGQLIYNTGILPLPKGAACMLYGDNIYPNWAHFYKSSGTICPTSGRVWNQVEVTKSYGYNWLQTPTEYENWNDAQIMNCLVQTVDTMDISSFCCQAITLSMHGPFECPVATSLNYEEGTPKLLQDYMNCVHYTDSCIGDCISKLKEKGITDNTTIVITGDHTVFKRNAIREYSYNQKYCPFDENEMNYMPLIILSPMIKVSKQVDDECYMMDIYPTIMNLIGADNYYWKGFGIDLSNSMGRNQRIINEEKAFVLSRSIIQSNYFSTFENKREK